MLSVSRKLCLNMGTAFLWTSPECALPREQSRSYVFAPLYCWTFEVVEAGMWFLHEVPHLQESVAESNS